MRLKLYKWDGHEINNGTTYDAFPADDSFFKQATGDVGEHERSNNPPVMANKGQKSKTLRLQIISRSSATEFSAAYNELSGWFDTFDDTERILIAKDEAASDKQYYVYATPVSTPRVAPDGFFVDLKVMDPIWRAVTNNTDDVWSITASGQTHNVTIGGNRPLKPKIRIKATDAKTGGFSYKAVRVWRNPITDEPNPHPLDVTNNAWDTAALVNNTAVSNQIDNVAGISAADATIDIDTAVGGGLPSVGTGYVGTEQISWTANSGTQLTGVSRGINGTTAAVHADNAVISKSKCQADGDDVAVFGANGGAALPRWLAGINTTTTQVWINNHFEPGCNLTLGTAIAATGALTTVTITKSNANKTILRTMEKIVPFHFSIGTEIFICTSVDSIKYQFGYLGSDMRAQLTSSMAAHSVGDAVYLVKPFWLAYGNASAPTLVQDETQKPLIDMDNSTNALWKWLIFRDAANLRTAGWSPSVDMGKKASVYGGSHAAVADPFTELGLSGYPYDVGGAPRADSFRARWTFFHPAGITGMTCNGSKYRFSTDYASVAGLWRGNNLAAGMAQVFNEATPAAAGAWSDWTQSGLTFASAKYMQFRLDGNVAGKIGNAQHFEVQTITSITIDSARIPQLVFSGAEVSGYEFGSATEAKRARLTNVATGEYVELAALADLNYEIEIDCDAETVTYLKDNSRMDAALDYPARNHVLNIDPRLGANQFKWEDEGTSAVTITFITADRNT